MAPALLFWAFSALLAAASVDYQKRFGGTGNSTVTAVATDKAGNTYLAGTTFALDFPVKNAYQPRNLGTAMVVSDDLGRTWSPLGFIPDVPITGVGAPAIDLRNPAILIAPGVYGIYRSVDAGQSWRTVVDLKVPSQWQAIGYIDTVEFDPADPSVVYGSASGGVLKSTDTGLTWNLLTQGLTPGVCCIGSGLSIDPFQSRHILYANSSAAFVSNDAGATWKPLELPLTQAGTVPYPNPRVLFDPHTRDAWYAYNSFGAYESSDGGVTWTRLSLNVINVLRLYADPQVLGRLFAFTSDGVWRSLDGGNSWTKLTIPVVPTYYSTAIAEQPGNPDVLVIAPSQLALISSDGGKSWQSLVATRAFDDFMFDPLRPNRLYAAGPPTSDVFVVKLNTSGNVVYSTYFGGQGNDTASTLGVDDAGNVYLTGTTASADFPNVTARLNSGTLPTSFAAKLDTLGKPVYVTLFGSGSVAASAVDAEGHLFLVGTTPTMTGENNLFAEKLTTDGTAFEYSVHFTGATIAISVSVDSAGNLVITEPSRTRSLTTTC